MRSFQVPRGQTFRFGGLPSARTKFASVNTIIVSANCAIKPAVVGPIADAFEHKQQGQGHDLARIQVGLRVFGHVLHAIIDSTKQRGDKIDGGHGALLSSDVLTTPDWGAPHAYVN